MAPPDSTAAGFSENSATPDSTAAGFSENSATPDSTAAGFSEKTATAPVLLKQHVCSCKILLARTVLCVTQM
jgi:hypothetical protein